MNALLEEIADERAILALLVTLARAQDDRDRAAYERCIADRIAVHLALIPGAVPHDYPRDEYIDLSLGLLSRWGATQHHLFNHVIEINGDRALCECDLRAVQALSDAGRTGAITLGGRYNLGFERTNGEWRMSSRKLTSRYQVGDEWILSMLPELTRLPSP